MLRAVLEHEASVPPTEKTSRRKGGSGHSRYFMRRKREHAFTAKPSWHAQLSWRILGWAARRGGSHVCEVVRALRQAEVRPADDRKAPNGLQKQGRLPARDINALIERNAAESRRCLDEMLQRGGGRFYPRAL
jgi:hypothetical protein